MAEYLEENLRLAYPFADQETGAVVSCFADAQIVAGVAAPLTLTIFSPLAFTNAHVKIQSGATVVLETTSATVTTLGPYTVLIGVDSGRQSSYKFICDTAALTIFPFLATPVAFNPQVCSFDGGRVQTLNGLSGDVTLHVPNFSAVEETDGVTTVSFQDPSERVDCSAADCAQVFQINGQTPDQFGSFGFANDGCHRVVPHPTNPAKLVIYNFCTPCLDCDDVDALNARQETQAEYYYQLSAIYHDQFNRYQRNVAAANLAIEGAASRSDLQTPTGMVDIGGRSYNPPYFSQLVLAVTNSSLYHIQIVFTVTITPSGVSSQLTYVPSSGQIHRYLLTGSQLGTFGGFPGAATVTLAPQETISIASEVHRSNILLAPTAGFWNVSGVVTYLTGPSPLPSPTTVTKQFPITLHGAAPTTGP